jgi:protein-disulfide isomerase
MGKNERAFYILTSLAAAILCSFALYRSLAIKALAAGNGKAKQPEVMTVSAAEVIGNRATFKGSEAAKNVLVEFMDYQCPPCKRVDSKLDEIVKSSGGRLKLTVRNLPLSFHKFAYKAALVSEAARDHGTYWEAHNALITAPSLDDKACKELAKSVGLSLENYERLMSSAMPVVDNDMKSAQRFKLTGTPSMILCLSNGKVLKINSPDQIQEHIQ